MSNLRHIGVGQQLISRVLSTTGVRTKHSTKQAETNTQIKDTHKPTPRSKFNAKK